MSEDAFDDNKVTEDKIDTEEKIETTDKPKEKGFWAESLEALVIAAILATIIRVFLYQPFYIPSGSMEPNLKPGDRIIVNKFLYRFTEPKRGDVMVFKYPKDPDRDFIKRVIGLPGDVVELRDSQLYINNQRVDEPYLPKGLVVPDFGPVTVPKDSYYMFGDNRNNSEDSRVWGEMPKENIRGKASLLYWPLTRFGLVKDLMDFQKDGK
ncbi:MAG TPA: signal peptidase I [Bacillota bacterium]|nr:signal peptidase I [Bacillota bacterium]